MKKYSVFAVAFAAMISVYSLGCARGDINMQLTGTIEDGSGNSIPNLSGKICMRCKVPSEVKIKNKDLYQVNNGKICLDVTTDESGEFAFDVSFRVEVYGPGKRSIDVCGGKADVFFSAKDSSSGLTKKWVPENPNQDGAPSGGGPVFDFDISVSTHQKFIPAK